MAPLAPGPGAPPAPDAALRWSERAGIDLWVKKILGGNDAWVKGAKLALDGSADAGLEPIFALTFCVLLFICFFLWLCLRHKKGEKSLMQQTREEITTDVVLAAHAAGGVGEEIRKDVVLAAHAASGVGEEIQKDVVLAAHAAAAFGEGVMEGAAHAATSVEDAVMHPVVTVEHVAEAIAETVLHPLDAVEHVVEAVAEVLHPLDQDDAAEPAGGAEQSDMKAEADAVIGKKFFSGSKGCTVKGSFPCGDLTVEFDDGKSRRVERDELMGLPPKEGDTVVARKARKDCFEIGDRGVVRKGYGRTFVVKWDNKVKLETQEDACNWDVMFQVEHGAGADGPPEAGDKLLDKERPEPREGSGDKGSRKKFHLNLNFDAVPGAQTSQPKPQK